MKRKRIILGSIATVLLLAVVFGLYPAIAKKQVSQKTHAQEETQDQQERHLVECSPDYVEKIQIFDGETGVNLEFTSEDEIAEIITAWNEVVLSQEKVLSREESEDLTGFGLWTTVTLKSGIESVFDITGPASVQDHDSNGYIIYKVARGDLKYDYFANLAEELKEEERFKDVASTDWFFDSVLYVDHQHVMRGRTLEYFVPFAPLKRAECIVALYHMEADPAVRLPSENHWIDVADDWYTRAVYWGFQAGIMTGYANSEYWGTADSMTREQLAVAMYHYAEYKKFDITKRAKLDSFQDAADVSGFAEEAVQWAVAEGLLNGKDGGTRLDPQGTTSRAECAAIMRRVMEKFIYKKTVLR